MYRRPISGCRCIRTGRDVQLTLDNDFNVPDSKPDMERIIQEKGMAAYPGYKARERINASSGVTGPSEFFIWGWTEASQLRPLKAVFPLKKR